MHAGPNLEHLPLAAGLVMALLGGGGVAAFLLWVDGPAPLVWGAAVVLVQAICVLVESGVHRRFPRVRELRVRAAALGVARGTVATALAVGTLPHAGVPGGSVPGVAVGIVVALITVRWCLARTTKDRAAVLAGPCTIRSVTDYPDVRDAARAGLANGPRGAARVWLRLHLAEAITESTLLDPGDRGPDPFVGAIRLLREVLSDGAAQDRVRLRAAVDLVDLCSHQQQRHGETTELLAALDLAEDLFRAFSDDPVARGALHELRGHRLVIDASLSDADPLPSQLRAACAEFVAALESYPPSARAVSVLGMLLQTAARCDDADLMSDALARARRTPTDVVSDLEALLLGHAIADLLVARARHTGDLRDLDEADRHLDRLQRSGAWAAGMAYDMRADIAQVRGDRSTELRARRAAAQQESPLGRPSDQARRWLEAAVRLADEAAAADAALGVVTALPSDLARLTAEDARDRFVVEAQGDAAEAGYRLVRAERPLDALRATDLARALLLGERVHLLPPDVGARLERAGRRDLATLLAQRATALSATRRPTGIPNDPPGLVIHGVPYATATSTPGQRAWAAYEDVRLEVTEVLAEDVGRSDTEATLRRIGVPIVVVGAAEDGGFVVVASGAGLACEKLPDLTATAARHRAQALLGCAGRPPAALLHELLQWCEHTVMAPAIRLLDDLTKCTPTTVVLLPLGSLALLPLHAAAAPVVVRYAPDLRSAAQAHEAARATMDVADAVVAGAPHVPDFPDLPLAAVEAAGVAVRLNVAPTASGMSAALRSGRGQVWHVACHAAVDTHRPLQSLLALADEAISVEATLTDTPVRRRLAFLSACSSASTDADLPDELLGFPGTLLNAGFAGVIASAWAVADDAALYLTLAFYDRWTARVDAATALAEAAMWLRTARRRDLQSAFPDEYCVPPGYPPEALEDPDFLDQRPYADPQHWAAFSLTGA